MGKDGKEKEKLLDRYLGGEDPICREERQYALFLYNYLCTLKKGTAEDEKIKEQLFGKESVEIEDVFYEATFMRDLFYWDKKHKEWEQRFNQYLLKYIEEIPNIGDLHFSEWHCDGDEMQVFLKKNKKAYTKYHLGMGLGLLSGEDKIDFGNKMNRMIKALMNSTPDIAVVYKDKNDVRHLAFLECKYESRESCSGEKGMRISQTEAQNAIAYFLTHKIPDYVAEVYDNTRLIQFYKTEPRRKSDKKIYVSISDLINLDNN